MRAIVVIIFIQNIIYRLATLCNISTAKVEANLPNKLTGGKSYIFFKLFFEIAPAYFLMLA